MNRDFDTELALLQRAYYALAAIAPEGRPAAWDYLHDRLNAELRDGKTAAMTVARFARVALAAGSRRAKTAKPVECEASQSGGDSRNAQ